jgi:CheY-like chemotaxis protein
MNDIVAAAVGELIEKFGCRGASMLLYERGRRTVLGAAGDVAAEADDTIAVVDGPATVLVAMSFVRGMPPEHRREARIFAESAANTYASFHGDAAIPPTGNHRILIVDDDDGIRTFVRRVLQRGGAEVVEAPNGLVGYARALEHAPDLIVIDWMMPVLDGRQALLRLKADPFTAEIPVVMLTSRSDPDDRRLAERAGAADVLAKPFTPAALIASVRRFLPAKEAVRPGA